MSGLTYEQSGVDYQALDAFKRLCQKAAATTAAALSQHGMHEPAGVRGDSAYLLETSDSFLAHVEEGLGTKNLIADAMLRLTGRNFYRNIGIDTVATIVNELITCGALPISVAMHAAVGDSGWFATIGGGEELALGFAEGCRMANAVWGGGETPTLQGIVEPQAVVLAGSALGIIRPKQLRITGDVRDGDAIIFLASSGVHTNGLSLCRAITGRLPGGYQTPIGDGRSFGEALLDPSIIYVRFITACQKAGLPLHYAVHLTGHGWRKLMRLAEPFVYHVTELPQSPPPIFAFLQKAGPIDSREMYATFNMGVGFAVFVSADHADRCVQIAVSSGYKAWISGRVRKDGSRKAVEIARANITFDADTLQVR